LSLGPYSTGKVKQRICSKFEMLPWFQKKHADTMKTFVVEKKKKA
jgi:hypothetical protein